MGWFSKTWKKVKNVFKKVTKVVKKVVKSVGKAAKKVWNGVKKGAKKLSKGMKKLGPFANIAMNFIPGFGQLWSAYGVWGQIAKGALVGFATTGEASGALLGAAAGGFSHAWSNLSGNTISEKLGGAYENWTNTNAINKSFSQFDKSGAGNFYMKDGRMISGSAPTGTQMMGRSSNAYGYAETQLNKNLAGTNYWADRAAASKAGTTFDAKPYDDVFKQVDIDAANYDPYSSILDKRMDTEYGGKKPETSWVDKLRKGTQIYSALKGTGGYGDEGVQIPYNAYDTTALTSYDTTAGGSRGQVGIGTDVYDVNKLGLLAAIDRIRRSEHEFGVA